MMTSSPIPGVIKANGDRETGGDGGMIEIKNLKN
jgi:hypothetical protein